jgi:hypothetical protein
MGILRALNRFIFTRPYYMAWNALMAAYAFEHLSTDQKQQLMNETEEIASSFVEQSSKFNEIFATRSKAELNYLYSLAFMSLGIPPALGRNPWYKLQNPHTVLISTKVLAATKCRLEKKFNVEFPKF